MEFYILGLLILLNGFFALSEISLVSSRKNRLELLKNKGSKGAKIALILLNDSENFLSAIQVGITLIGIVAGVYGGTSIAEEIQPFFEKIDILNKYSKETSISFTVVMITYFSIVIGELVPKTIALNNPEKIAKTVAPIIYYFSKIFYPVVRILSISTNIINTILRIPKRTEYITEADLRHLIKTASSQGIIEKEQNEIHEKVFNFSEKKAKHIMTHRTEIEWIDIDKPVEEVKEDLLKAVHSKIVCCHKDLEHFVGTISLKEFYKSLYTTGNSDYSKLLIPPIIIPEITEAKKILDIFREKTNHLCFVVDEYGSLEGIITLHDIIENIIGVIPEEGSDNDPDLFIREDKSVLVNGDAPVESLAQVIEGFEIDYEKIDYKTVAGFILHLTNKIPSVGETIKFNDYKIEIIDLDGNRIDKIMVQKIRS